MAREKKATNTALIDPDTPAQQRLGVGSLARLQHPGIVAVLAVQAQVGISRRQRQGQRSIAATRQMHQPHGAAHSFQEACGKLRRTLGGGGFMQGEERRQQ
jgi:hypothetical protein